MRGGIFLKKAATQIFKGVVISYLATILLLLFFSILLTYVSIDDKNIDIGISIITVVSVMVGAFIVSKKANLSGWLVGILSGGLYFVILTIITFMVTNEYGLTSKSIQLLLSALVGGVLGGIIGINSANNENE